MWDGVVGQDAALAVLERAVERPSHAYLLIGPRGSGVDDVAREFAARLVADATRSTDPDEHDRVVALARRSMHVDVVEFEPEGTFFLAEQSKEVIEESLRAPVEGDRKVIVLHDVDRMNEASGNKLLKTIEEPPARTVFVLTASRAESVLVTIRSRCQRVDFAALDAAAIEQTLIALGADPTNAAQASALSGGHLARARSLAFELRAVRRTFAEVPTRLDGTGAVAWAIAADIEAAIAHATEATEARQAAAVVDHDAELERRGYEGRVAQARRRRLAERHKRELTRLRRDMLLEGVTAIESVYRDMLAAPAPALNDDVSRPDLDAVAVGRALEACRVARRALLVNEKGSLHLLHLLLRLPVHSRR